MQNSQKNMDKIAIFASGTGSNAQKIIDYFKNNPKIEVSLIASNKHDALVLDIAKRENIPSFIVERHTFFETDDYIELLQRNHIDWIVLAGFLWKVPQSLINAYPQRIINIHPALLPKYGGKGMYGARVHDAVIQNAELESGISIHIVDEHYDHGDVIFQETCSIEPGDTAESLAHKVQVLEHLHFAPCIEAFIEKNR